MMKLEITVLNSPDPGRNRQYCDKSAIPVKCNAVEQISNEIRVRYTDAAVNAIIEGIGEATSPLGRHFSQNEDFFLQLEGDLRPAHPDPP